MPRPEPDTCINRVKWIFRNEYWQCSPVECIVLVTFYTLACLAFAYLFITVAPPSLVEPVVMAIVLTVFGFAVLFFLELVHRV